MKKKSRDTLFAEEPVSSTFYEEQHLIDSHDTQQMGDRNPSCHTRLAGSPPRRCRRQPMVELVRLPRRVVAGLSPIHSCSPRVVATAGSFGHGG
jgi:hypothetical protein